MPDLPTWPLLARLAPLIICRSRFVDLATIRQRELATSLSSLGIEYYHDTLPDGRLAEQPYRQAMSVKIAYLVHKYDITGIATLGTNGYCGHPDHIATHQAAVEAKELLRQRGRHVDLFGLDHDHAGNVRVPVAPHRKLGSLSTHASQMPLDATGTIVPEFWRQHPRYQPLLHQETYTVA